MKKISFWLFILAFVASTAGVARAQDTATQQQLDKLSGQIQDLYSVLDKQDKKIADMEKKIGDLQDKLNKPGATPDTASADDLKKLATQVQELAKKQQSDNDLVLKELEKLAKGGNGSASGRKSPAISETPTATLGSNSVNGASSPQNGYEYTIGKGDTVDAIARAYRAQNVKVTTDQILAANPGLNPNKMIVGKKIFIPDPGAK